LEVRIARFFGNLIISQKYEGKMTNAWLSKRIKMDKNIFTTLINAIFSLKIIQ